MYVDVCNRYLCLKRVRKSVCVCVYSLFERFAVRRKVLQSLKRYIGYLIYHYRPDVVVSKSTWTQRQNLCWLAKISEIFIRLVFLKIFPDSPMQLIFLDRKLYAIIFAVKILLAETSSGNL